MKLIRKYIDGKQQYMFTRIGWCDTCGQPYHKIGKGTGSRKYCDICSLNSRLDTRRSYESHRPERNEYKNELRRKLRGEGRITQELSGTNVQVCGKPPEDPTDKDWMEYHNKIKKMKKDSMGGYQDYYDIDEDVNPYS